VFQVITIPVQPTVSPPLGKLIAFDSTTGEFLSTVIDIRVF